MAAVDYDGDDASDYSDTDSIDSCEEYIHFQSIRNSETQLEEAISFSWPGIYDDEKVDGTDDNTEKKLRKIAISTLLEEDDLAPLFDGSRWAGTRLWAAAVRAVQFLSGHLPDTKNMLGSDAPTTDGEEVASILELGCGLGVPGMIFHLLGCNVVLTDQIEILSQLEKNVLDNFPNTSDCNKEKEHPTISDNFPNTSDCNKEKEQPTINAMDLSWSRSDANSLLEKLGRSDTGFDIVLNCDCVYEPLYGDSWHLLNETIDELLKVNPKCLVVSSMERRQADGIDQFLEEMRSMGNVGSVEKVWSEEKRKIEIYMTRGIS